jgi:cell division transport system permease protein
MLKFKPGTVLSILSFSISLFILGFYLLLLIHLSNFINIVNQKTPFIIELKDSLGNSQLSEIKADLSKNSGIQKIEFVSREVGLKLMEKQLGQDYISGTNPLKDILKLKLSDKYLENDRAEKLAEELRLRPWVETCYFEKDNVDDLKSNLSSFNSVLLIIALIFIILSFILIYNNLKFILHSDRFQIKTMELIGASPVFIKKPYIKLAVKIGIFSGLFAVMIIVIMLLFLNFKYDIFNAFLDYGLTSLVLFLIFIISLISPPVFINFLVNKYLKMTDKQRHR